MKKRIAFLFVGILICLFAAGCGKNAGGSMEREATGAVINETPTVTPSSVETVPKHHKSNPVVSMDITTGRKPYLSVSETKNVRIISTEAVYNDFDFAFPTVLLTIKGRIEKSEDPEEAIAIGYTVEDGMPPSRCETGIFNVGAGYEEGDEFEYVLELQNLVPGLAYFVNLVDGRELVGKASKEVKNALQEDGRVVLDTSYGYSAEDYGLYKPDFVVKTVDALSFNLGNKYNAISFVFRDEEGKTVGTPATADIKYVSSRGETIYESSVTLNQDNFRMLWTDFNFGDSELDGVKVVGKILIPNDLSSIDGTLYVTFSNEGVFPAIECSYDYEWISSMGVPDDFNGGKIEKNSFQGEPGVVY